MKKSIKKVLFMLSTVILSVVLTACGAGSSKTPTSQEVLEKYSEVAKNIKSAKFTSDVSMKITTNGKEQELKMNMNGTVVNDPISMLVDYDMNMGSQSQKISMYLKDADSLYVKQSNSSKWQKAPTNESIKKQLESIKQVGGNDKSLEFYKNNASDFKVSEQGDNYVLTYTGNDEKFKELLKQSNSTTSNNFDSVEFKNIEVKVTVKKSNYEPVESYISADFSQKSNSANKAKMEVKFSFSDINSAKITAPEGI